MKKSLGAKALVHPAPVWIVASYDKEGKPNTMTAAWGGMCCSKPPCVTVSLRKATYSFGSILLRKAYTINVPSESQVAEADYFGIASGKTEDKFAATGFTPVKSDLVDAPVEGQNQQDLVDMLMNWRPMRFSKCLYVIRLNLHVPTS